MFSMRIVNVDHYLSQPKSRFDVTYSEFRGNEIKLVPVIRIFGSTNSGSKACLHVHGVFPYILVPYTGEENAGSFIYQLAASLDKAINVSMGVSHSNKQHVFKIVLVSGRPFYGYHSKDHQFLKIFFYNPLVVKRASDLLQNGAVCGTRLQIHEGHVPFTLQFFIDYNLYGMSYINIKNVVNRGDPNTSEFSLNMLPKESVCEVEADAVAVDILNRLTIEGELAVNPGLEAIWKEEKMRLNEDVFDDSQRPTPQRTSSDILLMERLNKNLGLKAETKTILKEKIPYPAETPQLQYGFHLNASVLDTHSISSLEENHAARNVQENVDEELILTLSKSITASNSADVSLLMALDHLETGSNDQDVEFSQKVEEDSILGTQMVPDDENVNLDDASENELDFLDLSLPAFVDSEDDVEPKGSDLESDENFDDKIPQLDGMNDLDGVIPEGKEKSKKKMIKDVTLNSSTSDGEVLENNGNNCWPESNNEDGLDNFLEAYNSPLVSIDDEIQANYFEDPCIDEVGNSLNVSDRDLKNVLRGDPTLSREDVFFDDSLPQTKMNETYCCLPTFNQEDNSINLSCNNNNKDNELSQNRSTDIEKSMPDLLNGDENIFYSGTTQLDDILNDDLNKGLDFEYDSSDGSNEEIITEATSTDLRRNHPETHSRQELDLTGKKHFNKGNVRAAFKNSFHDRAKASSTSYSNYAEQIRTKQSKPKILSQKKRFSKNKDKILVSPTIFKQQKSVSKCPKAIEMTENEITRYFRNVQSSCSSSNPSSKQSWSPLRKLRLDNNKSFKPKPSKMRLILNKAQRKYNASDEEILKLITCFVELKRDFSPSYVCTSNTSPDNKNQTSVQDDSLKHKMPLSSLQSIICPSNQVSKDFIDPVLNCENDKGKQQLTENKPDNLKKNASTDSAKKQKYCGQHLYSNSSDLVYTPDQVGINLHNQCLNSVVKSKTYLHGKKEVILKDTSSSISKRRQQEPDLSTMPVNGRISDVIKPLQSKQLKKDGQLLSTSLLKVGAKNSNFELGIMRNDLFQDENLNNVKSNENIEKNIQTSKRKLSPSLAGKPLCNQNRKSEPVNGLKSQNSNRKTPQVLKYKFPSTSPLKPKVKRSNNSNLSKGTTLNNKAPNKCNLSMTSPELSFKSKISKPLNNNVLSNSLSENNETLLPRCSNENMILQNGEIRHIEVAPNPNPQTQKISDLSDSPKDLHKVVDGKELPKCKKESHLLSFISKTDSNNKILYFVPVLHRLPPDKLYTHRPGCVSNHNLPNLIRESCNKVQKRNETNINSTESLTSPCGSHLSESSSPNSSQNAKLSVYTPTVKLRGPISLDLQSSSSSKVQKNCRHSEKQGTLSLLSLDGAFDNSSDEEEIKLQRNKNVKSPDCSTSRKRKHSKKLKSPTTSYNPLDITIKKSPSKKASREANRIHLVNDDYSSTIKSKILISDDSRIRDKTLVEEGSSKITQPVLKEGSTDKTMSLKPSTKKIKSHHQTSDKYSLPLECNSIPTTSIKETRSTVSSLLTRGSFDPFVRVERLPPLNSSSPSTSTVENNKNIEPLFKSGNLKSEDDISLLINKSLKPQNRDNTSRYMTSPLTCGLIDPVVRVERLQLPISQISCETQIANSVPALKRDVHNNSNEQTQNKLLSLDSLERVEKLFLPNAVRDPDTEGEKSKVPSNAASFNLNSIPRQTVEELKISVRHHSIDSSETVNLKSKRSSHLRSRSSSLPMHLK